MSYQHLNTFERTRIETMKDQELSLRQIGKKLIRVASTISRELKRNAIGDTYHPQGHYQMRSLNCVRSVKWSQNLADRIHAKLSLTWSPVQIVHGELKGYISFKTIYHWLYQGDYITPHLKCFVKMAKDRNFAKQESDLMSGHLLNIDLKMSANKKHFVIGN